MEPLVDNYKTGHSVTLGRYSTKITPMLPPRSSQLLQLRGPSLPAQSIDLSAELAIENKTRRNMHKTIMEKDPGAFRKKERAESASSAVHHRMLVKDLLGEMHQLKDFNDIDKTKTFTRSILYEQEKEKSINLKEYHFQTMKPIEDFVRPEDQFSPRITGYEHGHVRSLLKLDVFGPASSAAIEKEREQGILPRSPNIDRHTLLSPGYTLRPDTGNSGSSSRGSTVNSTNYNGAFPSLKTLRKGRSSVRRPMESGLDGTDQLSGSRQLNHPERVLHGTGSYKSASVSNFDFVDIPVRTGFPEDAGRIDMGTSHGGLRNSARSRGGDTSRTELNTSGAITQFSGPALLPGVGSSSGSRRPGSKQQQGSIAGRSGRLLHPEQTFPGVAITEEERLLGGDPFLRRTSWYKSFASSKKIYAENKEIYKNERKLMLEQQKIAAEERKRMKEFEDYLVLAKYNP